ncbi:MAG: septum site-determining protein MinD [Eubacteriaceae bacterium]|nr:septum site-determining protein MinD [Eubacteriaceae bacterium]
MSKAIVVTSGKGGVGKTTCTANLGVALALQGHSVVVVDADIGLRNLDVVLGMEDRITYTIVDIFDGKCRIKQALIRDKRFPKLCLIAAAQNTDKSVIKAAQMVKLVEELKVSFEFVLIDCPAGIESGFHNAVAGADEAIIVTTPEVSAVRDADRIISILREMGHAEPKLVLNKIRPEMVRRGEMMDMKDVLEILDIQLIGIIPEQGDIVIASNRGEPVSAIESSLTGQAYNNIAQRVLGKEVPFLDLAKRDGLFARLAGLLKSGI